MTTTYKRLLSGAALAAFLPAVAMAQEATTGTTTTTTTNEVPIETTQAETATTDTIGTGTATTGNATTQMAQDGMASQDAMQVTNVQTTSSAQPVDLSTWTYDDLYANGISVAQILGADVYGPAGDDVGDVDNVIFDMDGQIQSIVARMNDGFLGLGRSHVNIPWDMVSAENWADGLVIPFNENEVDAYAVPPSQTGGEVVASEEVAEVEGGVFQNVETGSNAWLATDLINNTARLRDGDAFANYGVVNDLVVRDGRIAAVLVQPDAAMGGMTGTAADGTASTGLYGYPFPGTAGWTRGGAGTGAGGTVTTDAAAGANAGMGGTFDLPYDTTQAQMVQPFDPAMLTD